MRAVTLILVAALAACDQGRASGRTTPSAEIAQRLAEARRAATDGQGWVQVGEIAVEGEQWFEAAEAFKRAREAGVESPRVFAGLALTYVRLGYAGSTVEALRECFQRSPREPDCLLAFARLIERDPAEGAKRETQRTYARFLLVAPPDHPQRAYAESALAQLDGQLGPLSEDEILGRPRSQPASGPSSRPAEAAEGAAAAAAVPGHDDAEKSTVGELNPFGRALQTAYSAWEKKDHAAAEKAFQQALSIRKDDPPVLAELARLVQEQGRSEEAIAFAEKAWSLAPEDAQVRFAFGLVMLRNERKGPEAIAAWQALLRDSPDYAKQLGVDELLETAKPQ